MKKITFYIVFAIFLFAGNLQAQGWDDDPEYSREFIWGITKATNTGLIGGFHFKYGLAINGRMYQHFGLDLQNLRHPQEMRFNSSFTGNFFSLGKLNHHLVIRPNYGRELVLFKKAQQQGVQVNAIVAAGPSLGLEVPYYVDYFVDGGRTVRRLNRDLSFERIAGSATAFAGLREMKIVPGAHLKTALAFEFSAIRSSVTGVEVGLITEAYSRAIVIMPMAENRSLITAAYITIFYGTRR